MCVILIHPFSNYKIVYRTENEVSRANMSRIACTAHKMSKFLVRVTTLKWESRVLFYLQFWEPNILVYIKAIMNREHIGLPLLIKYQIIIGFSYLISYLV